MNLNNTLRQNHKYLEDCAYICIVPVCVINPSLHTQADKSDLFRGCTVATLASETEHCMAWTRISGIVNFDPETLSALYFNMFDNIAKIGFRTIVVYYCGDSRESFDSLSNYATLYKNKPYTLHHVKAPVELEKSKRDKAYSISAKKKQNEISIAKEAAFLASFIRILKADLKPSLFRKRQN